MLTTVVGQYKFCYNFSQAKILIHFRALTKLHFFLRSAIQTSRYKNPYHFSVADLHQYHAGRHKCDAVPQIMTSGC